MPDSHHPEVRVLDLFAGMSAESYATLMRGSFVQNFPPQVELISEGEPSDFLHILLSGSVDLFARWNGRETLMAGVHPVSTFILAATIRDAPYLMSGRTTEKSRIALIPSSSVREVFDTDPVFARAMVVELAMCYRGVVKNTKDLKLRTSLERLANRILRQHKANGGAREFDLDIEKWRLASLLGMTPENLSRALRSLQAYGVAVSGNRVRIDDPSVLERFAKPSPLIDDQST